MGMPDQHLCNRNLPSPLLWVCKRGTGAQEVAGLLPGILHRVRLVWTLSRFYNTPERILSLLRKIGQEVTARCAARISLTSLFNGDAIPVQAVLLQVSFLV